MAVVAHRGRSADFPENSLSAFRAAIALGVDAIELDVRTTRDGELVVLHDPTLNRTTGARGRVSALTLAQIRALPPGADGSPAIPTLAEVLALVRSAPVRLLLDIKQVDARGRTRLVAMLDEAGLAGRAIIGVRSASELRAFRSLAPKLRLLGFIPNRDTAASFAAAGADAIRLWSGWLEGDPREAAAAVAGVRGLGREVWIMVEERPAEDLPMLTLRLQRLRSAGADAIVTDHPELLLRGIPH
jgi:glycerophosphoryl diester phosphodiesterase